MRNSPTFSQSSTTKCLCPQASAASNSNKPSRIRKGERKPSPALKKQIQSPKHRHYEKRETEPITIAKAKPHFLDVQEAPDPRNSRRTIPPAEPTEKTRYLPNPSSSCFHPPTKLTPQRSESSSGRADDDASQPGRIHDSPRGRTANGRNMWDRRTTTDFTHSFFLIFIFFPFSLSLLRPAAPAPSCFQLVLLSPRIAKRYPTPPLASVIFHSSLPLLAILIVFRRNT